MGQPREHFSADLDASLLAELKTLAEAEGRELRVLIDEAIAGLLKAKKAPNVRDHVMATYKATHDEYADVYKKLAE
ncbi:MAG: hypothetical protein CMF76_08630 [Maricaulis sp.]|mgnify:CR=1 FL=1|nr:hypothetical protein [Oceanicaulis sp.]MAZ92014.1 hypothetical protein [Maricaulis sp.]|tara:strand:+ start:500 stop:727 length:228 start_codon:yes stop_codon:yes gene_type:complete